MKCIILSVFLVFIFHLVIPADLNAQAWEFIKERDGIKVYSRIEETSSLKSFKGEVDLHSTMDKVSYYIGNVQNLDWWGENIKEVRVLHFEKDKVIRYYLEYIVPWPFSNRDLCVEAKITTDAVTGKRTVFAEPLPDIVPEKPGVVRIKRYWQKWTAQPMPDGIIHLTLEGFVDPGGNVPSWLYNMVITDTPLKLMREIKDRVEVPSPG
jgi:hypothetical protein